MYSFWSRLPVRFRKRAAHALFSRLQPALPPVPRGNLADPGLPRIVVGLLSSPTGLGQSARLTARALREAGHAVYGIDLGAYFYEPHDAVPHDLADGRRITGPAHLIININAPYLPYVLSILGGAFLQEKHVTGYWAWELPLVPRAWARGLPCVHDIAAPSRFVADAIRHIDPVQPVFVLPHPVALDAPPASAKLAPTNGRCNGGPFTVTSVLNLASGYERKNPLALIAAFRQAFGHTGDCRLRILVGNADQYPPGRAAIEAALAGNANIHVTWDSLDREALWRWWQGPDVYASLHRAEGFGLPLAEAMCAGYPVVATGWSGNMDFMTAENSFPVRYRLTRVRDPQAKYDSDLGQWAEPDIAHAAQIFQRLRERPELGIRAGRCARKEMARKWTAERFAETLTLRPCV